MKELLYNLATDKYKGFIPGIFKCLLFLLSLLYGLVIKILAWFYRLMPCALNCKVISVGNITFGGTGKTVLVEYLAKYFKSQGRKVAILTRGYKSEAANCANMGDEPYMLQSKLKNIPVIVDADRIRGAQKAIKDYGADIVVLDDGFQQWKVKKDLEIVAIDSTDPFGNQRLIPRGILREPLTSLKRADIFILTKTNLNPDITDIKDFLSRINPRAAIFGSTHQPVGFYDLNKPEAVINIKTLEGKNVALFCGIGDPDSFENLILSLGINVNLSFNFADHHNYSQVDLEKIAKAAEEKNIDILITTEKDAARLGKLVLAASSQRILALSIKLEIKNEQEFHNRLLRLYSV